MKRMLFCLLAALALLGMAACGKGEADDSESSSLPASDSTASQSGYPIQVGGAELTGLPDSIVSLSPALTELVCDLGYFNQLSGISDYCSYEGQDLDSLPRLGTVNAPQVEEILSMQPAVVLSVSPLSAANRAALEDAGIAVVLLPRAKTFDELQPLYQDVGRVCAGERDGSANGDALFEQLSAQLEQIRASLQQAAEGKELEVCYLRVMPLTVATGDTFEGELLEKAGFINSAAAYTDWTYPDDKAIDLMPDVIFYDSSIQLDALAATPLYNTTPAYQNAKCFTYDLEVFERQGQRMFRMLNQMVSDACGKGAAA